MIKQTLLTGAALALLSGAAAAADLPRRVAPPPVFTAVPVFSWTGFYAGLHTDYVFTDRQRITTVGNNAASAAQVAGLVRPATVFNSNDGFANIGGGFGYNYQFTPGNGFVVGVQADWAWTDLRRNTVFRGGPGLAFPSVYTQRLDWLGTLVGRAGYAFDRFFVYGMGGLAYGDVEYDANFFVPGGLFLAGRNNTFETGFAYGGGVEYAIPADSFLAKFNLLSFVGIQTAAVTVKAEYLHYDLGSRNVLVSPVTPLAAGAAFTSRFHTEGNLVRGGFSYKFNGL
ncbi:outer membrane protein [Methylobacterium sp. JK268]